MDKIRGSFHSPKRGKQVISFEGMEFERKITPTDFDAVIDFGSEQWVLIEYKVTGNVLTKGQRRCLTSALNAHESSGIKSLGIVANHDCPPEEIVVGAKCNVSEVWTAKRGWRIPTKIRTVMETINLWRECINK